MDLDKLLETLRKRLAEQRRRHQGGSKWIGTAGTSPYGAYGYNPEGVRIGQDANRNFRAVKVWDKREFKDLDDEVELGTRNIKLALRRLRKFARTGAPQELDLDGTIKGTAHKGYLDILMRPERHNAVKVLLFFDIGGSMDWHIKATEELFSAARSEFKHMEYYYFHNCLYERVWKENRRRFQATTPTWDVLHTYPHDYKVIFVGDASMSPYEIAAPGGSVEHYNDEPGATWLDRVTRTYPACVWLNPVPEKEWAFTHSIGMIHKLMGGRMYPLTLDGLAGRRASWGASAIEDCLFGRTPSLLVNGNPLVVCFHVRAFDRRPGDHVRPFLAVNFSGMCRVSILNASGKQVFSDTRWQVGVYAIRHVTNTLLLDLNDGRERVLLW